MQVTVVGKKVVDFENRDTKERIEGINLYVIGETEGVQGKMADKRWVKKENAKLYEIALSLDVSSHYVDVELIYETQMGSRNSQLVGIKVLPAANK